mgnify:CR=1
MCLHCFFFISGKSGYYQKIMKFMSLTLMIMFMDLIEVKSCYTPVSIYWFD